ncbi:MAG TPA: diheme cytochrome c [Azospirillaceae bacterium]|nr:diheme cytochrome c [Azospirillaceae bacterium]
MMIRALAIGLILAAAVPALAGELERVPPVTHAATKEECGSCHMAYQPAFLPAASWNAIMDNLSNHFGENAGLPADTAADIRQYLTGHAGRGNGAVQRISDLRWWQKEHRRISDAGWKKAGSKAACQACHTGAEQGMFEDD